MVDEVAKQGHRGPKFLQTLFLAIHGSKTAAPSKNFTSLGSTQEGISRRASQGLAESTFFERAFCPSGICLKLIGQNCVTWLPLGAGKSGKCSFLWLGTLIH